MKLPNKLLFFSVFILMITFYGSIVAGEKNTNIDYEKSLRDDSKISGSRAVCLNGAFIFVEYATDSEPGDRIYWSMKDATDFEVSSQRGDVVSIPFTSEGTFTVSLRISRGGDSNFYSESINVIVEKGPTFILPPDVVQCGNEDVALTALDPNDPNLNNFSIEWTDVAGNAVGSGNTIFTNTPGRYIANVSSNACKISGSTFVGPSLEVELAQTATSACLGQKVTFTPDVPVNGMWSYQKTGQTSRTELGNYFVLELETDELEGIGDYTIFLNVVDEERPGCSVEKQRNLTVTENASFEIFDVINSESCDNPTGQFRFQANTGIQSVNIFGPSNISYENVSAETILDITALEPGIYIVSAESLGCTITSTVSIENNNPDDAIPFTVRAMEQSCSGTGIIPGTITITVEDYSPGLNYKIYSKKGEIYDGSFDNSSVSREVPADEYLVEVSDVNNCGSVSAQSFTVLGSGQVNFSVPSTITACEYYDLVPQSSQTLLYELTGPDGQLISRENDGSYRINSSGKYEILAISDDTSSSLCPNLKSFEITINDQVEFEYSQRQIDCLGNQIYTAELLGRDPSSVFIRWLADDMVTILGRDLDFFPPSTGTFYLDVQPRASSQCPSEPIPFEVTPVQREVDVDIEGTPFCGLNDPFTTLSVVTDFEVIEFIEWYFIDEDENYIHLENLQNMEHIDVADEGTYEVVVRNDIYCEMGRTTFKVDRVLEIRLNMSAMQYICIEENKYNALNPGDFANYTWLKDGNVVSTDSIYIPRQPGTYELEVIDHNGCTVDTQFEVEDICSELISMPTAMIPGDLDRDFRVYANPAISEVEVFIFNKLGELIFHCQSENMSEANAMCIWDGYVNGTKLMIGTYPVTIKYKVPSMNLSDQVNKYIVVPQ
ncbi:MAG TPA: hypothetical protein VK921_14940 [Anditalea sp.]|nr:hypothetical protein [Anditalea sp.]